MISAQSIYMPISETPKICNCCPHLPRRLDGENLLILSLIQLLCGSAAIILFGVALTKEGYLHQVGTGMWSGTLMLAAGSLGVATSRHRTACTLISLLVICTMTAVTSAILASVSTAGLVQDGVRRARNIKIHHVVLHTLLFIVGFLECSVAVTTAIICGRQVCFGAIYFPRNTAQRRINSSTYSRGLQPTRSQCSLFGPHQDLHGITPQTSSITGSLAHILRNSGQVPVLTTNTFYTNVIFPQLDSTSTSPLSTHCRTSLVYLLPSPSPDEPSMIFPSFPPSYSIQESRPLSPYPCLGATEIGDVAMQPVLLVEEQPPPYTSFENLHIASHNHPYSPQDNFQNPCVDIHEDNVSKALTECHVELLGPGPSVLTSRSSLTPSWSSSSSVSSSSVVKSS